jgi:LuxR family maltose regulon positive regulatory protein
MSSANPVLRAVAGSTEPAEARLHAPPLRAGVVSRTALVNRLRTQEAPVVLLTAPAGYGKTTVLVQWAKRDARSFVWAALGRGDGDAATLPRLVAEALARAVTDPELDRLLAAAATPGATFQRRLARWLRARPKPLVLVLDNVEFLDGGDCAEFILLLSDHLPPESQLVLCGRSRPGVHLARLRAEGRLFELTGDDLRLTDREARAMMHDAAIELSDGEADDLNRRAGGWPTGIYLAGLGLRPLRGRRLRAASSADGAHHFIAEYFDSEVLARLRDEDAEFVLEASLLDSLSGRVCDAVLGVEGSGRRLRRLDAAGAFVVAVNRERTAFRLHDFFRDTLRRRLEEELPGRYRELSSRAAVWCEGEGDLPSAIDHLRAIGDRAEGARLLGAAAPDICGRGLLGTIEPALLDLHDEALLLEHQPAAIAGAFAHAFRGHAADTERWAAIADAARNRGKLQDGTASSATWAHLLRATLCRDGMQQMRKAAVIAQGRLGAASAFGPFAVFLVGVAQLGSGGRADAEQSFATAADLATAAEAPLVETMALAELSLLAQDREEWERAELLATRARDIASRLGDGHVGAALAYAASARSALRHSNWVRAGDDIDAVQGLLPQLNETLPWLSVQVRLELARAQLALNDVAKADELVTEAERLLLLRPFLGTLEADTRELRVRIRGLQRAGSGVAATLTAAELRLLPLLTTHLTFRQIAQHLYVSRNTIKTQAISVYRKLGVSSRTQAIDRAIELGLLRPESEPADHLA